MNRPSRFIREIPSECINEVRPQSRISRPVSFQKNLGSSSAFAGESVPDTDFHLGQRVAHGKFGEGVVLNYEGQGAQARVQINFDASGAKWLVVSYAKLQAI